MHRFLLLTAAIVTCLSSVVPAWAQQDNGKYVIVDSFPLAASFAVASDKTAANEDQRIVLGAGGGAYTLDGSSYQPTPEEAGTPADYRVRAEGCVRAIRLLGNHIYVVAKEGGLQRFDALDHHRQVKFLLNKEEPAAWSLDVVEVATDLTWALVGSNDDEADGTLYVVTIDDSADPDNPTVSVKHEINLGVPVYSVAATTSLVEDRVSVFVGTSCGTSPGCSSLYRFDIDPDSSATPSADASWPQDCDLHAAIRDIVLDETASGGPRAYVAAYTQGLRAFDISESGLAEITTDGWPIRAHVDPDTTTYRFNCLDLYGPENLIVAGMGNRLEGELQTWGDCSVPQECDAGYAEEAETGVVVFDLDDSPVDVPEGTLGVGTHVSLPSAPLDLAVRQRDGGGELLIDVSCLSHSLVVARAVLSSGIPRVAFSIVGHWDETNSPSEGPKAPGGGFDDALRVGDSLYVTTEGTVLTFDLGSSPSTALGDYADLNMHGAVFLSRMSDTLAADPNDVGVLYSREFFDGIRFWDISDPLHPAASAGLLGDSLGLKGRGYSCYAVESIPGSAGSRWLYVASLTDTRSATTTCNMQVYGYTPIENGSIRVFQVDDTTEPTSANTQLLGGYVPAGCPDNWAQHGSFMDVVAVPSGQGTHAVWATYGPRGMETGSGLLVLEATLSGTSVAFTLIGKLEFLDDHEGGTVSRLTYLAAEQVLYASYGCGGVVRYDVSDPLAPVETGRFEFTPLAGELANPPSLQVYPAVAPYVYVSLLTGGVGILNSTDMESGWQLGSPFDTGFEANAFWDGPEQAGQNYADGSAVWLLEAGGGINLVQFKVFP